MFLASVLPFLLLNYMCARNISWTSVNLTTILLVDFFFSFALHLCAVFTNNSLALLLLKTNSSELLFVTIDDGT